MDFDNVLHLIDSTRNLELPGHKAHQLIMPLEVRRQIFKDVAYKTPPRQSAVLALIYPDKSGLAKMVFILRKTYKGHHSGQISFPGGKYEPFDKDLQATALRETYEEIGVSPEMIDIQRVLSPVFIPVSNFKVQPFLGVSHTTLDFVIDPVEVEEIFSLDFETILNNPLMEIFHTYFGKTYRLKAFKAGEIKIWGATAMILSEIVTLLNPGFLNKNL